MSDFYDKIKEDVVFRRMWAEKCGFGFELPSVVTKMYQNAPKTLQCRRQRKQLKEREKRWSGERI